MAQRSESGYPLSISERSRSATPKENDDADRDDAEDDDDRDERATGNHDGTRREVSASLHLCQRAERIRELAAQTNELERTGAQRTGRDQRDDMNGGGTEVGDEATTRAVDGPPRKR